MSKNRSVLNFSTHYNKKKVYKLLDNITITSLAYKTLNVQATQ
jgi:hypothetical protein